MEGVEKMEKYIEQLQELGRTIITNENVPVLQTKLERMGYKTEYKSTDRDYLVLIKKEYCTSDGNCSTCSLSNYGRDCQNNAI